MLVVSSGPRPVGVPNVVGAEVAYAARRIRDEGLRVTIDRVRSSEAAGTVLAESPDAGYRGPRGTVVHLSVAKPAPAREPRVAVLAVPRVVGLRVADAEARLDARGLSWRVTQQDSDRPKGEVVSQTPDSGARVRKGARVTLGVSSGPAPVPVPDVTGLDEASARSELDDAGFSVSVVDQPTTDPTQDGLVVDESPAGGSQAKRGATVTITVARYG